MIDNHFSSLSLHEQLLDYFHLVFPTTSKIEFKEKVPLWCLIDCFIYLFDCWFEPVIEDLKDDLETHLKHHIVKNNGFHIKTKIQTLFKKAFYSSNTKYFVRDSFTRDGKGFPCNVWFEALPCANIDDDNAAEIAEIDEMAKIAEIAEITKKNSSVENISVKNTSTSFLSKLPPQAKLQGTKSQKDSPSFPTKSRNVKLFNFSPSRTPSLAHRFSSQSQMGIFENPFQQHLHHQLSLQRKLNFDHHQQQQQQPNQTFPAGDKTLAKTLATAKTLDVAKNNNHQQSILWSPLKNGHPVLGVQFGYDDYLPENNLAKNILAKSENTTTKKCVS